MPSKSGVFIFTKNRENILADNLSGLANMDAKIYVIDDSNIAESIVKNKTLCQRLQIPYFGREEQGGFLHLVVSTGKYSPAFIKLLGDGNWNLGFARNYALLLCAQQQLSKVLFLDDDITVRPLEIDSMFFLLDEFDMVGMEITGMPDDSILGHISTSLGITSDKKLSGGCLYFNTRIINGHFLNYYNEDWIWQYFQPKFIKTKISGNVNQLSYDPFSNYKEKILFQEIGECLIDGIDHASSLGNFDILQDAMFWRDELHSRKQFLEEVHLQLKAHKRKEESIVDWLTSHYPQMTPDEFAFLFQSYARDRAQFMELYWQLRL